MFRILVLRVLAGSLVEPYACLAALAEALLAAYDMSAGIHAHQGGLPRCFLRAVYSPGAAASVDLVCVEARYVVGVCFGCLSISTTLVSNLLLPRRHQMGLDAIYLVIHFRRRFPVVSTRLWIWGRVNSAHGSFACVHPITYRVNGVHSDFDVGHSWVLSRGGGFYAIFEDLSIDGDRIAALL